ncbi:MAG: phosphatase PAP2 family protein [Bacilli bacterium]
MKKTQLYIALINLVIFIVYTILVKKIDTDNIGPNDSIVGFSHLNIFFYNITSTNFLIYELTDWAGIIPIIIGFIYGFVGLFQWIKRKNILKVDSNILSLGILYLITFGVYMFFEYFVINRRPVLIDGYLEASYPSSTTMLVLCFMITSIDQTNKYCIKTHIRDALNIIQTLFIIFMVIGRILSGVHWLTDIVGGIIISISLIKMYQFFDLLIKNHQKRVKYLIE